MLKKINSHSNLIEPEKQLIFMVKDKFENEKLIAYGYDTDIWYELQPFTHSLSLCDD
jgi:hypothetical protein